MSRPAAFAKMGDSFVSSLGNVDIELTVKDQIMPPMRGIFRAVREVDLLELEGVGAEGVQYTLAVQGTLIDGIRHGDKVTILDSDDAENIDSVFQVVSHRDDGRSMKRLFLVDY